MGQDMLCEGGIGRERKSAPVRKKSFFSLELRQKSVDKLEICGIMDYCQ